MYVKPQQLCVPTLPVLSGLPVFHMVGEKSTRQESGLEVDFSKVFSKIYPWLWTTGRSLDSHSPPEAKQGLSASQISHSFFGYYKISSKPAFSKRR